MTAAENRRRINQARADEPYAFAGDIGYRTGPRVKDQPTLHRGRQVRWPAALASGWRVA